MTTFSPPSAAKLTSLCVFCGSRAGTDPVFATAATVLGTSLAENRVDLVYGGGRVGLMGILADAALKGGGTVTGVIPTFLKDKELAHTGATEMVVVPDMHTRKRVMFERSDAFCILPGGVGTLEEMFEVVTWRQLHLHNKPIIVANVAGYWSELVRLFDRMIGEGFAHRGHESLITVVERAEDIVAAAQVEMQAPKAPVLFKV